MAREEAPKKENGFAIIRCAARRSPEEPNMVEVGVNGKAYSLQRGKLVPVPQDVVNVLNDAEIPYYTDEDDEMTGRRALAGMTKRYPFEVVRRINEEQYAGLRAIAMTRDIAESDLKEFGLQG